MGDFTSSLFKDGNLRKQIAPRHSRFQSPYDLENMRGIAVLEGQRRPGDRNPQFVAVRKIYKEVRRHYSDNRVRLVVHHYLLSDHLRTAAEFFTPEPVTQYDLMIVAGQALGRKETAANRRFSPKNIKKGRRHHLADDHFGLALSRYCKSIPRMRRYSLEHLRLFLPDPEVA